MTVPTTRRQREPRVCGQSWQNRSLVSAVLVFPLTSSTLAVGDPAATRTVYLTTIALVLLGIGLGVLAWWLFRRTRPEPELFAPLEEMETRSWRKLGPAERTESLDAVRPWGARPVSREDGVGGDPADDENAEDDTGVDDVEESDSAVDASEEGDTPPVDESAGGVDDANDDDANEESDGRPPSAVDRADDTPAAVTAPAERPETVDGTGDALDGGVDAESVPAEDDPTVAIDRAPST